MRAVLIIFAQRERHSMRTEPNNCVQARPGFAFCLFLRRWHGAPDAGRSA
jgi:hypothetical protein